MPINTELIERIIKQKSFTKGEIADKIGMTREGFTRSLLTNKLQADKLESLAKVLHLPFAVLFDGINDVSQEYEGFEHCVMCELKDELIALKIKEITALNKMIAYLEIKTTTQIH